MICIRPLLGCFWYTSDFLMLRSNVVGSQPVGQLEPGLKMAKKVIAYPERAIIQSLPTPPVLSELS